MKFLERAYNQANDELALLGTYETDSQKLGKNKSSSELLVRPMMPMLRLRGKIEMMRMILKRKPKIEIMNFVVQSVVDQKRR
jgi:hypothetical protein